MEGRFRKAEFAREGGVQNQLLVHVIEACAAAFQWGNTSPIISHHLPSSPIHTKNQTLEMCQSVYDPLQGLGGNQEISEYLPRGFSVVSCCGTQTRIA